MRDVARTAGIIAVYLVFTNPQNFIAERPLENFRGAAFQTLNSSPAEPVLILPIPTLGAHAHASLILHLGVKRAEGITRESRQRRLWNPVCACLSTYTTRTNVFLMALELEAKFVWKNIILISKKAQFSSLFDFFPLEELCGERKCSTAAK